MSTSSDEDSQVSDSEIDKPLEKSYQKFLNGVYKVLVKGRLRCPFCLEKKKQYYNYKELLAHSSNIKKQRAKHLGLARYLETDLAGSYAEPGPSRPSVPPKAESPDIYVWPFMGIVINPVKGTDDKAVLLDSAYWMESLSIYKPLEVNAVWVEQDSILGVIAKFGSDMAGFASAIKFETTFENIGCSKKDWMEKRGDSQSKTYGWFARSDDYNSEGPIGEYLSKEGKLRTISDISQKIEEDRQRLLDELSENVAVANEAAIRSSHLFKREGTNDKAKEVVDDEDEQLKKLKGEGEEVHNAVKTALEEKDECNPSVKRRRI